MNCSRYPAIPVLFSVAAVCAAEPTTMPPYDVDDPYPIVQPLTRTIRLIADTQIHESRGTASRFFSLAGDEFIPVTIRTAQQVIGAADMLHAALSQGITPLTLHLGDAIDVSCQTEWNLFSSVMKNVLGPPGPSSWLFAPGNHDGFLVGNFYPQEKGIYKELHWSNVCNAGRITYPTVVNERLSKTNLIDDYVRRLTDSPPDTTVPKSDTFCKDDMTFCVAYYTAAEPWASYIVQLVKLPEANQPDTLIYALLLDTSDYPTRPYVWPGSIHAGEQGGISARQSAAALALIERLPSNARYFITGHHPITAWRLEKWSADQQQNLHKFIDDPRFLRFFVTAHTHKGGWFEHAIGATTVNELNLGSLADSPVHFRSLMFGYDADGQLVVNAKPTMMGTGTEPDCADFTLPENGSGYSVDDQRSVSDSLNRIPGVFRTVASSTSALRYFFKFWKAKHQELAAQLFAYADVVVNSMPKNQEFVFQAGAYSTKLTTFRNRQKLLVRMRYLAKCFHKTKCSVQEKGHLLLALEKYYWDERTEIAVRQGGHRMRYCGALLGSKEALGDDTVLTNRLAPMSKVLVATKPGLTLPAMP